MHSKGQSICKLIATSLVSCLAILPTEVCYTLCGTHLNSIIVQLQFAEAPQLRKDSVADEVQIVAGEFQDIQVAQAPEYFAGQHVDLVVGQVQVRQPGHVGEESLMESAYVVVVEEQPLAERQVAEGVAIHLEDLVVLQVEVPQPNMVGEGVLVQGHYVVIVEDDSLEEGQVGEGIALHNLHLRVLNHDAAQVLQGLNYHGGNVVKSGIVLDDELQLPQSLLLVEPGPGGVVLVQSLREYPALGLLDRHVVLVRGTVAHQLHVPSSRAESSAVHGSAVANAAGVGSTAAGEHVSARGAGRRRGGSPIPIAGVAARGCCRRAVAATAPAATLLLGAGIGGHHGHQQDESEQEHRRSRHFMALMMRQHCDPVSKSQWNGFWKKKPNGMTRSIKIVNLIRRSQLHLKKLRRSLNQIWTEWSSKWSFLIPCSIGIKDEIIWASKILFETFKVTRF